MVSCSKTNAKSQPINALSAIAVSDFDHRSEKGLIPGEAAILRSMREFAIELPRQVTISFDSSLNERGRTQWRLTDSAISVLIGSAAFESRGLLGSTIAHEIEVHCHQD